MLNIRSMTICLAVSFNIFPFNYLNNFTVVFTYILIVRNVAFRQEIQDGVRPLLFITVPSVQSVKAKLSSSVVFILIHNQSISDQIIFAILIACNITPLLS